MDGTFCASLEEILEDELGVSCAVTEEAMSPWEDLFPELYQPVGARIGKPMPLKKKRGPGKGRVRAMFGRYRLFEDEDIFFSRSGHCPYATPVKRDRALLPWL